MPNKLLEHKWTIDDLLNSARDHLGSMIDSSDSLVVLGGFLGAIDFAQFTDDPKDILLGFATGACAVRGLSSQSEIVGAISVATLASLGVSLYNADKWKRTREIIDDYRARIDSAPIGKERLILRKEMLDEIRKARRE